jgi:hypothetical protein
LRNAADTERLRSFGNAEDPAMSKTNPCLHKRTPNVDEAILVHVMLGKK